MDIRFDYKVSFILSWCKVLNFDIFKLNNELITIKGNSERWLHIKLSSGEVPSGASRETRAKLSHLLSAHLRSGRFASTRLTQARAQHRRVHVLTIGRNARQYVMRLANANTFVSHCEWRLGLVELCRRHRELQGGAKRSRYLRFRWQHSSCKFVINLLLTSITVSFIFFEFFKFLLGVV